jgi:hypothetical protein
MVETEYEQIRMPLIGDDAPSFTAVTTQGEINFPEDYKRKMGNSFGSSSFSMGKMIFNSRPRWFL